MNNVRDGRTDGHIALWNAPPQWDDRITVVVYNNLLRHRMQYIHTGTLSQPLYHIPTHIPHPIRHPSTDGLFQHIDAIIDHQRRSRPGSYVNSRRQSLPAAYNHWHGRQFVFNIGGRRKGPLGWAPSRNGGSGIKSENFRKFLSQTVHFGEYLCNNWPTKWAHINCVETRILMLRLFWVDIFTRQLYITLVGR